MARGISGCILLILIFLVPWWMSFLIAAVLVFVFNFYLEFFFVGLILDSLYNVSLDRYNGFGFILSLSALIILVVAELLKKRLKFYS